MVQLQENNKRKTLAFAQILKLLLTQSKRKVRIRMIDTIFFTMNNDNKLNIASWYYTSNKGELVQRGDILKLTLQNIHDRFCRISPQGSNKIVAVGYIQDDDSSNDDLRRVTFTLGQLHREAKNSNVDILRNVKCLQYYVHPCQEKHQYFRAIYSLRLTTSENGEKEHKSDVEIYPLDDLDAKANVDEKMMIGVDVIIGNTSSSALHEWVHKELEVVMSRLVQHIEFSLTFETSMNVDGTNIIQLVADFVLDDNKRLFMTSVNRLVLDEDRDSHSHIDLVEALSSSFQRFDNLSYFNDQSLIPFVKESNKNLAENGLCKNYHENNLEEQTNSVGNSEEDDDCHLNGLQDNIRNLQQKLRETQQMKDDKLVQINMIIPEIRRAIPDICSSNDYGNNQVAHNQITHNDCESSTPHIEKICSTQIEISEIEINEAEEHRIMNDAQPASVDKNFRNLQSCNLEVERNNLLTQLEQERYEHAKTQKLLNAKNEDLIEDERRTREELDLLLLETKKERQHFHNTLESIRASNSVLEAELKAQREYVNKIKSQSYGDLWIKVQKNIEAAIVQGLSDSCLGSDNAVASCEEIWKSRLEEMAKDHARSVSAIHEDYHTEINYKATQHKIQMKALKSEVEGRIQRRVTESLRAAIDHKERQHQEDLKNEMKRWEQILSEVKARTQNENQNKLSKLLRDRDEHWQNKLKVLEIEHSRAISNVSEEKNKMMDQLVRSKNEEIDRLLEQAKDSQSKAIKCALEDAKSQHKSDLQSKDAQWLSEIQKLKKDLKEASQMEATRLVAEAIKIESLKIENANIVIEELRKERESLVLHQKAEIEQLQNSFDLQLQEKERQIKDMAMQIQTVDAEQLNAQCEQKLEEIKSQHQEEISKIIDDANNTVKKEIERAKLESEKVLDDTINELTLEHEEKLQALDYEIGWLKTQHNNAEAEVKNLKDELGTKNGEIYKLKEDLDFQLVRYSFQTLFLITKALITNRNLEAARDEAQRIKSEANQTYSDLESNLTDRVKELEKKNSAFDDQMKLIGSTILNYKREELLNHKIKSREVASLIQRLAQKIETVEAKRDKALSILDNLELSMHEIEKQLQDHAQTSALENGKINLNHMRKKRRLDEEYEQILNKIELQRDELNVVEKEVMRLNKDKNAATEDMRKLEKSLVELLIGQQKKLLNITLRDESS